jgi:hypothetical protein
MAEDNGLPAVLIARTVEGADVPAFRGDDAYGIALATNHLISLGHRRIAMIGGTDQTSTGRDRYQGYVNAMHKAGLEVEPELAHAGAAHQAGRLRGGGAVPGAEGQADRGRLLERSGRHRPDERHRARRPVPGVDISVTGYDDLEEAAIATPALTTVWNGQREVGRRAARVLLDRLNGAAVRALAGTDPARNCMSASRPDVRSSAPKWPGRCVACRRWSRPSRRAHRRAAESGDHRELRRGLRFRRREACRDQGRDGHQHAGCADRGGGGHGHGPASQHRPRTEGGGKLAARRQMGCPRDRFR